MSQGAILFIDLRSETLCHHVPVMTLMFHLSLGVVTAEIPIAHALSVTDRE